MHEPSNKAEGIPQPDPHGNVGCKVEKGGRAEKFPANEFFNLIRWNNIDYLIGSAFFQ